MKTQFLVIACFLVTFGSFAQRNLNQKQFKSSGRLNSLNNYNSNSETDGLFYNMGSSTQNSFGSTSTYIKDNEMIFDVKAIMNVEADRFLAVFNLTQVGETALQTNELMSTRIKGFISGLTSLGISEDDLYTDMIYLIPTYEYEVEKKLFSKTYNEVPSGFEMQKNIHVSFTDIDLVDDMVTLAAKNEIYDLVKLDFFIDSTSAVYDTLRSSCVNYLNKKISDYEKLDLTFKGKYHVVREASKAIYPESQYTDYDAFVSQSLEAAQRKSGVSKLRKPKTVAYDQIPTDGFDIVINPGVLEPVVQFVYKLEVKYTINDPEKEKNKPTYMLVTPNGDVKPLNIQK